MAARPDLITRHSPPCLCGFSAGRDATALRQAGRPPPQNRRGRIREWLVMPGGIVRLGRFVPPPDARSKSRNEESRKQKWRRGSANERGESQGWDGGDGAARRPYHQRFANAPNRRRALSARSRFCISCRCRRGRGRCGPLWGPTARAWAGACSDRWRPG